MTLFCYFLGHGIGSKIDVGITHLLKGAIVDRKNGEALLTPAEVAALFRVDPKTVTRWAKSGKLSAIRTLGGHRRYSETEVRTHLAQMRTAG